MLYHCWLYAVPRTWNYNVQWVRDTDKELLSAVVGAEGLINSRLLTDQSSHPDDPTSLTPTTSELLN